MSENKLKLCIDCKWLREWRLGERMCGHPYAPISLVDGKPSSTCMYERDGGGCTTSAFRWESKHLSIGVEEHERVTKNEA